MAQEQEHPAVRTNRQDAGDEISLDRQAGACFLKTSVKNERSSRAAASGSSASSTARTTAKPGAPASATSRAVSKVTPPIANQGTGTPLRASSQSRAGPTASSSGFVGVA